MLFCSGHRFLPEQSQPDEAKFAFAYHITIDNTGDQAATLLSRYWRITDGNQKCQEVAGPGVVGEQPRLEPGGTHSYTSGVLLDTPVGTMEGHYHFQVEDRTGFDVPIAPFLLAVPGAIN